jgi:putative acetyltransferase
MEKNAPRLDFPQAILPTMPIRRYRPEDAALVAELFHLSVRVLGARRYSAEQTAAWSPVQPAPETVDARACDGRVVLVATDADGKIVGFGELEADGHIDRLYVHPDAAGTGTAAELLDALLALAAEQGLARLHVEASELARGLFERRGFRVLHRRDFELRGVPVHNWAMSRP